MCHWNLSEPKICVVKRQGQKTKNEIGDIIKRMTELIFLAKYLLRRRRLFLLEVPKVRRISMFPKCINGPFHGLTKQEELHGYFFVCVCFVLFWVSELNSVVRRL